MSDYCKIGPISIHNPHLVDGSSYKTTEEEFEVYCTHWQYKQLLSLIDEGFNSQGTMGVTILNGDNPWSPVYIDSSLLISDNDYLKHKGWYIVTNVEISDIYLNKYLKAKITVSKVSSLQNEMLTMDYTTGVMDGTGLDSTYSLEYTNTLLSDTFDTYDTSKWTSGDDGLSGASITSTDGYLVFSGASTSNGTFKSEWIILNDELDGPFTATFDLNWISRPVSGAKPHILRFGISTGSLSSDGVFVDMRVYPTYTSYVIFSVNNKGVTSILVPTTTNNATAHNWTFTLGTDGKLKVLLGGTQKYYGPSNLSTIKSLKCTYRFYNASTTSKSMKIGNVNISRDEVQSYNNIVGLPAGSTPVIASDFARASADGNIPCYANPTVQLPFTCADPYLGSVKAYTNNNPDNVYRQMFGIDEIPTATGFYVTNGIVKLVTTSNGVTFQYWNGASWATLNTFNRGTLTYLKLLDIGPMGVTFQANTTKWTLKHNSPYVTVKHPNDALTYTLKDTYDHDSTTTTSPLADADITMNDISHAEIYNNTDIYRMQIYKLDPCTIKSDSIPASSLTGIGFYDSTLASSSYNSKDKLPLEFPIQTDQHISIKQV